jgi:hypothetical protein
MGLSQGMRPGGPALADLSAHCKTNLKRSLECQKRL